MSSIREKDMILDGFLDQALRLRDAGDLKLAYQIMGLAVKKYPESPAALGIMAQLCWSLNRLPGALRYFERASKLAPRSESASLGLFHLLWETGDRASAIQEMERFLQVADSEDYREIRDELAGSSS